jgi:acetyl esterase
VIYAGKIVYFHGGGFVTGDLDSHDIVVRALARATRREVVSVHYRLAPEHRYPAAADDAIAVTKEIASGGGDVVVCGDSAGGNLAAVAANACASVGLRLAGQVLVYPATDFTIERSSCEQFKDVSLLTRDAMRWFKAQYTPDPTSHSEPSCSPLLTASFDGVAPAYVLLARCDLLHDEGLAYHAKLQEAGVDATLDVVEGVSHSFFSMQGLSEAQDAVVRIAAWLERKWVVQAVTADASAPRL